MAQVHKIVAKALSNVNNDISNAIPLIMLGCLIHLVVTPYFLLIELIKPDLNIGLIVLQSVWILAHSARLLMIVEPCQKFFMDGQRTSYLVCELLGTKNTSEEFNKAITLLKVQVSQTKLKFSCYNLFKLDRSIITTVAGSVTTYIVILFQFKTSQNA